MKQQDYTKATTKLTAFSSHTSNLQAYKDLANIGLNLAMNNLGYPDINATQETTIRTIANGTTTQAAKAKEILHDAFGEIFEIDKPIISSGSSKRANFSIEKEKNQIITLSPNPAKRILHVHWSTEISEATQIIFYNLVGKEIATFNSDKNERSIDVSQWKNGLYIAKIEVAEGDIQIQKILINR